VPFLRVIRDRRGYETTYLMHWYREGPRQRSRILYVFRTPGGARVGRAALDPEVLRQIESQHPEIAFDWKVIRENQQIIEPAVEPRRRPKREAAAPPAPDEAPAAPAAAAPAPAPVSAPALPPIPAAVSGTTADEQIAFLGEWYPRIRERIPRRTSDPVRQRALFALAERLNPATWTDADRITAGLAEASEALERLSKVFAKRRRRSRRRSAEPAAAATSAAETTPADASAAPLEIAPMPDTEPPLSSSEPAASDPRPTDD